MPSAAATSARRSSAGGSSSGSAAVRATGLIRPGSAPVSRDSTVGFARSASSPGATLRTRDRPVFVHQPPAIHGDQVDDAAVLDAERDFRARAFELPAQRAQLVRVSLGDLVVDGNPAVPRGETTVSREVRTRGTSLSTSLTTSPWSSVCRWTAPNDPSRRLNRLLVVGSCGAERGERDSLLGSFSSSTTPSVSGRSDPRSAIASSTTNESPSRRTFIPDSCSQEQEVGREVLEGGSNREPSSRVSLIVDTRPSP